MRDLNYQIQKLIINGKVLSCTKTKRLPIGKCQVTVGRYQTAVPGNGKKYALFIDSRTTHDRLTFIDPIGATSAFIDFVGREIALSTFKRKRQESNATPGKCPGCFVNFENNQQPSFSYQARGNDGCIQARAPQALE